jgi:hypothetical protein
MKSPNGYVYVGEWKNGRGNGQAVIKYASGDVYEGEMKDSKRHGQGTMKIAPPSWMKRVSADIYEGQWKNGEIYGQGTMKYADGRVYIGQWRKSIRHGHGTLTWQDGDVYVGEWDDDERNGRGVLKSFNGEVMQVMDGLWMDNKLVYQCAVGSKRKREDGEDGDGERVDGACSICLQEKATQLPPGCDHVYMCKACFDSWASTCERNAKIPPGHVRCPACASNTPRSQWRDITAFKFA